MQIVHPTSAESIAARNLLLQSTLRPEPLPFAIADEYPLVLAADAAHYSYCIQVDDQIVAHANLWPRILFDESTRTALSVGLIGNVATDEKWRGKGLMRQLFVHLMEQGKTQKMHALFLWSDLDQFYQNLGFTSRGKEQRVYLHASALPPSIKALTFLPTDVANLSEQALQRMLWLRNSAPVTLQRSPSEFRRQLSIPMSDLFVALGEDRQVVAYCIVGRGYDMVGVLHEWAMPSSMHLLSAAKAILRHEGWEDLIVLGPANLPTEWTDVLQHTAKRCEEHRLALMHQINPSPDVTTMLDRCFIWGMDSI